MGMANPSITVPITPRKMSGIEFFAKLFQVGFKADTATVAEVAEVVDELYDLNLCDPVDEDQTEDTVEPTGEDVEKVVKDSFGMSMCYMDDDGNYFTQVEVVLSDMSFPYELKLSNGEVTKEVVTEATIDTNITVKESTSVSLTYPVTSGFEATWVGDVTGTAGVISPPAISYSNGVLLWAGVATGNIRVSYVSTYYLVDITVFGNEDKEPSPCNILCFYHGSANSLDLQVPKNKEEYMEWRERFCGKKLGGVTIPGEDVPQWVTTRTTYKCDCSEDVARTTYSDPPTEEQLHSGEYKFPGVIKEVFGGYVDCGEYTGDMDTPEFYEQECCYAPEVTLPHCVRKYRRNPGGNSLPQDVYEFYHDSYGDQLKIVAVTPEDGECGTIETKQVLVSRNCCDTVTPITITPDANPDILPAGESVTLYFTGGKTPYTVTASTPDISIAGQGKTAIISTQYVEISSTLQFCGATAIKIADGCSTDSIVLRSEAGHWEEVVDTPCVLAGCEPTVTQVVPGDDSWLSLECVVGNKRQVETIRAIASYHTSLPEQEWLDAFYPVEADAPETNEGCGPGVGGEYCVKHGVDVPTLACSCAEDAGMPYYQNPPCADLSLVANPASAVASCSGGGPFGRWWVQRGGAVDLSCSYPHMNYSGGVQSWIAGWWEQDTLTQYIWVC